jgi:hypothetical protein
VQEVVVGDVLLESGVRDADRERRLPGAGEVLGQGELPFSCVKSEVRPG